MGMEFSDDSNTVPEVRTTTETRQGQPCALAAAGPASGNSVPFAVVKNAKQSRTQSPKQTFFDSDENRHRKIRRVAVPRKFVRCRTQRQGCKQ